MSSPSRYILGLSFFYHDSAAVLVKDGQLIAAASEERFTRKKQDSNFPLHAVSYVLKEAGITAESLTHIAYYEDPRLHFARLLRMYAESWPGSFWLFVHAMPSWLGRKLWIRRIIRQQTGFTGEITFVDHHRSHAASAFFCSPFKSAAVITMDGVGEWATTTWGIGKENVLELKQQIRFPDSLGLFYSTLTHYLGFKPNSGEYKVMGLAPYGKPIYVDKMRSLIETRPDSSYRLRHEVFGWHANPKRTLKNLAELFGTPARTAEAPLEQVHMDIAASLQIVLEERVLAIAAYVREKSGEENICLAGGVALNCVANSKLLFEGTFKNMFIQPAAGDAGGALGAALYLEHTVLKNPRKFEMKHAYWGPSYNDEEIENALKESELKYSKLPPDELITSTAKFLADDAVIGWFQGRMEWGPRSLGNRSILGDARKKENWKRINLKIKFRESFRPFAPSVLAEDAADYFDLPVESPYMLLTAPVTSDDLPAVTHLDRSARVQTVTKEANPLFHELISAFKAETGCSVLINTSFNVRSEPIVCSPEDAIRCFLATDIDYLVLGSFRISKADVPEDKLDRGWVDEYELD